LLIEIARMAEQAPGDRQQAANKIFEDAAAEQLQVIARRVVVPAGPTRQRYVQIALAVSVPVLAAVLLISFAGPYLASWLETAPPAAVARQEAQKELDTLVAGIEAYRKDFNDVPKGLVQVGVPQRGRWSYTVIGTGRYRVQGALYGEAVSFTSPDRTALP
jgi:hypothetical protein